jgi:hypothetical protein
VYLLHIGGTSFRFFFFTVWFCSAFFKLRALPKEILLMDRSFFQSPSSALLTSGPLGSSHDDFAFEDDGNDVFGLSNDNGGDPNSSSGDSDDKSSNCSEDAEDSHQDDNIESGNEDEKPIEPPNCGGCRGSKLDLFYQCRECYDDDFYLCRDCYSKGLRCHDRSHPFEKKAVQDGKIVEVLPWHDKDFIQDIPAPFSIDMNNTWPPSSPVLDAIRCKCSTCENWFRNVARFTSPRTSASGFPEMLKTLTYTGYMPWTGRLSFHLSSRLDGSLKRIQPRKTF